MPPYDLYQRQRILPGFGDAAQHKLSTARVLLVGAGGLGCPALQYLAAMGVAHLGVVDADRVSAANLHRQVIYSPGDIGRLKTEVVQTWMQQHHPGIALKVHPVALTARNACDMLRPYDMVLDCTDNFETRYLLNDATVLLGKPLVYGAVFQYQGQVAIFNAGAQAVQYRDLFPACPSGAINCAEAGAYSIITGIVGLLQAGEAVKLITGLGDALTNKLLTYDALSARQYTVQLARQEARAQGPQSEAELLRYDYTAFCGKPLQTGEALDAGVFAQWLQRDDVQVVDIRNYDEQPVVDELHALRIPMAGLRNEIHRLDPDKKIVFICHSGVRTAAVVEMLEEEYHMHNVYHLKGGLVQWMAWQSTHNP